MSELHIPCFFSVVRSVILSIGRAFFVLCFGIGEGYSSCFCILALARFCVFDVAFERFQHGFVFFGRDLSVCFEVVSLPLSVVFFDILKFVIQISGTLSFCSKQRPVRCFCSCSCGCYGRIVF